MRQKFKFKKKVEEMTAEELRKQQEAVKKLKLPEIRTLDFLYSEGDIEVTYEYPELTALCPMTGLQDTYTVRISYTPNKKMPELKSLRFYFLAYRDVPILHEHLICKIFEDFNRAVEPKNLRVELDVAIRGGIHTRIVKETEKTCP